MGWGCLESLLSGKWQKKRKANCLERPPGKDVQTANQTPTCTLQWNLGLGGGEKNAVWCS